MDMEMIVGLVIRWAIPVACAAVTGWAAAQVRATHARDCALQMGVLALLRDRLYQAHSKYTAEGEFPIHARENVEELYKCYTALGGNGTVKNLVHEMNVLPTARREAGGAGG